MRNLVTLLFLFSVSAGARAKIFKETGVSLNVPKNWDHRNNTLGFDHLFFGPVVNNHKPTVGVIYNKGVKIQMDFKKLKAKEEDYRDGRRSFMLKKGGTILKFSPYKFYKNKNKHEVHQLGYEYKYDNGMHYVERSYFIICNKELYNLKSSIIDSERRYLKEIREMVETFNCKK